MDNNKIDPRAFQAETVYEQEMAGVVGAGPSMANEAASVAQWTADTDDQEADSLIDRLLTLSPSFTECERAAAYIHRTAGCIKALRQMTEIYAEMRKTLHDKYPLDGWSAETMTLDNARAILAQAAPAASVAQWTDQIKTTWSSRLGYGITRQELEIVVNIIDAILAQAAPHAYDVKNEVGLSLRNYDQIEMDAECMAAPPAAPARSISDEMMDLADRLGSQAGEVDPRAWKHLLVYAPPVQGGASELLQAVLDHDARIRSALITQKIRTPDDASHQAAKDDQKSWDAVADRIRALLAAPAAPASEPTRVEQLRKALFEARDAMRVMANWVKKSDPAGHSWGVRMVDRANDVLGGSAPAVPATGESWAEQASQRALAAMVDAMRWWGKQEDGIPVEVAPAFNAAMLALGWSYSQQVDLDALSVEQHRAAPAAPATGESGAEKLDRLERVLDGYEDMPDATPPAAASAQQDEREAFEAWAGDWFFGGVVRCGEGYAINSINSAWYSWQARAAQQVQAGGEDKRDTERLDWLAKHGAWVAWGRDGEFCRVFHHSDDEDGRAVPFCGWGAGKCYPTAREAIDAALSREQPQPSNGDREGGA